MVYKIKELRQQKGITQKELSKHLGIAQNTLSYWENGRIDIDTESLCKIADYFNVSVDYLIGDSTSNTLPKNLSVKELDLLRYFRGTMRHEINTESKWGPITKYFPHVINLTTEEQELLDYYHELSKKDQRWIMGQMIDLIKRADEHSSAIPKAQ